MIPMSMSVFVVVVIAVVAVHESGRRTATPFFDSFTPFFDSEEDTTTAFFDTDEDTATPFFDTRGAFKNLFDAVATIAPLDVVVVVVVVVVADNDVVDNVDVVAWTRPLDTKGVVNPLVLAAATAVVATNATT